MDERTVEEKTQAAAACYASFKKRDSRRTCSGCHLDYYCRMPHDNLVWLEETFLPAIDPTGAAFGRPARAG